jgi:4-amino-4-deoxy-L-arabinose transferase-like glycosyltransferase
MDRSKSLPVAALWVPAFGMFALALSAATRGLSPSFLDPDESAHYVNTLFLADWLRAGLPSPMAYARDYYAHFPKLSIGHWPPGWYALLAPLFAVVRPSPLAATMLGAFVAGVPALVVPWALDRAGHRRWGPVGAFAYLLLPLVAEEARYFRLDQPVALVVGLAAIAWWRAVERPGLWRYLLFGALAAFATLVKGNGALIVLVPALDILMAARWRQLADARLWIAAAATLLVVAPWYYVSFRISAGGFNYAPGPAYAWLSLQTDAAALEATVGWFGIAAALAGTILAWRDPTTRPIARLSIAVIVATLLFQAAIPVALEDRYVLPAVPWLVVLVALGLLGIARQARTATIGAALLAVAIIGPGVVALTHRAPKPDSGAPAIAAIMARQPGIWLVDGRAGGEGAVIAAAAYADDGARRLWVARASQWLSTSDFMGNGYALSVHGPAEARAVLDRLGVRGVVSIAERGQLAYPHSALLRAAVALPGFAATTLAFPAGAGSVAVATRTATVSARPDLLAGGSGSHNVATMGATLR